MSHGQRRWVLSGGLASGKSKVRGLLEDAGIVTIDADSFGHMVLQSEGPAYVEVAERWPHVIQDGEVHRPSLAEVVFGDVDELRALEAITHPHTFEMIRSKVESFNSTVVVEIPLLSHGLREEWQRIVVDCRDDVRLHRAVERGMSEQDARSRMAAQPSRSEWLAAADIVIPNHGALEELRETVSALAPML